jgi:general secretion pathway protein K
VERAVWSLRGPEGTPRWRSDGTPYLLALDGGRVAIAVLDESGRIDLNRGSPELLLRLLGRIGLESAQVERVHQLIMARREPAAPVAPEVTGQPAAPPGAGGPLAGRPAPFQSPLELLQLPLPESGAIARILPYVTVFAPDDKIAPQSAPALVLASLQGVTQRQAEGVVAARSRPAPLAPDRLAAMLAGARDSLKTEPGPVYRILVDVTTRRGGTARLETVVWIGPAINDVPYRVLAWQENWPADSLVEGRSR